MNILNDTPKEMIKCLRREFRGKRATKVEPDSRWYYYNGTRTESRVIIVRYHYTDIATIIYPQLGKYETRVEFNNGGFYTPTTKNRINAVLSTLGLGYHIYQKNFKWYLYQSSLQKDIPIAREFTITVDGNGTTHLEITQ